LMNPVYSQPDINLLYLSNNMRNSNRSKCRAFRRPSTLRKVYELELACSR